MKSYILKHKNNRVYLKYFKNIQFKHYVSDYQEATNFTKSEAKRILGKYKHPENWEIIENKSHREGKNTK